MNKPSLFLGCRGLALCGALALAGTLRALEIDATPWGLNDEVVCKVNTETISKHQVEEDEVISLLISRKAQLEASGQWNADAQKFYEHEYNKAFRTSLRRVVRQRLMLQYAKADPAVKVDEPAFQKKLKETLDLFRRQGLLSAKGITATEVEKRVRESMLAENWRWGQFGTVIEQPREFEVKKYYQENINRFTRPAGVMVRIIRIDGITTNKLTGQRTARREAEEVAKRLHDDLEAYSANFAEVAKANSDDEETKGRGGLIMVDKNDPYFNPEGYSPEVANILRGMEPGQISRVFDLKASYAFVKLEGRRVAGPAPLEGALHEEILRSLLGQKMRKLEDAWFRKALSKSLVVKVVNAVEEVIPADFFFEEENEPAKAQEAGPTKAEAEPKKK